MALLCFAVHKRGALFIPQPRWTQSEQQLHLPPECTCDFYGSLPKRLCCRCGAPVWTANFIGGEMKKHSVPGFRFLIGSVWSNRLRTCPAITASTVPLRRRLQLLKDTHPHTSHFLHPWWPLNPDVCHSRRWQSEMALPTRGHSSGERLSLPSCFFPSLSRPLWPLQPVAKWPIDPWLH